MRPRVDIEELERRVRESLEPGVELRRCGEDDPEDLGFHALDDGVSLEAIEIERFALEHDLLRWDEFVAEWR